MRKLEKLHLGGQVLKTHGKEGEIKLAAEFDVFLELLKKAEYIFILNFGSKVPYRIDSVRGGDPPIVSLEDINTPEDAEKLCGNPFYFLDTDFQLVKNEILTDPLKILEGFLLIDTVSGKRVGDIVTLVEVPGQILATVFDSETEREHIIPIHSDLIVHLDEVG
ncbi:MAG: hypothetical protein EA362_02145, partial [Saprospirales bacterium]